MKTLQLFFLFLVFATQAVAQTGIIEGKVVDRTNKGFPNILIQLENHPSIRTISDLDGNFSLSVPVGKNTVIYQFEDEKYTQSFSIEERETKKLKKIQFNVQYFTGIEVTGRKQDNTIDQLPMIDVQNLPGPKTSVESYITLTTAATSNNELTNNYNVRGGSYDENLIYVNGFEVYRPFLTRSGEQEGMSFINPNLVENISFSAGGFTANYGDRLSSVLDITYRTPTEFRGSFNASLLGVEAHVEDEVTARFNYMVAGRYQDKGYLLNALPTKGAYNPRNYDVQILTNYAIRENLIWSVLGHFSSNDYIFAPETQETRLGTVEQPLSFKVYFEGQEMTKFQTITGATSLKWDINDRDQITAYAKIFNTDERETFDILGEYFINELETDPAQEEYGDSTGTLGVGAYLDHARNRLQATVYSLRVEGKHQFKQLTNDGLDYVKKGRIDYGIGAQYEDFYDVLSEWGMIDSAGYSLPQSNPYEVELDNVIKATNTLSTFRSNGFIQYSQSFDNFRNNYPISIRIKENDSLGNKSKRIYRDTIDNSRAQFSFNVGLRGGYTAFNDELYLTPRAVVNYYPRKYYVNSEGKLRKRYLRLHANAGMYYQPPFYRELRRFDGTVNTNVKSQKSAHAVAGLDYAFEMWHRKTPFKLSAAVFYKYLWDVNPYYLENVKTRYFADNNAIGHSFGADVQLHGEFIKGIESFFKIGLLRSIEDIKDDEYYTYVNSDGEKIIPGYTFNDEAVDSIHHSPGFIPKPTDQWFTFATLFQDRMPGFEQFTVQLGLNFGSRLPYGPPGHDRYKDTLRQKSYFRVDIGFGWDFLYQKPVEERMKMFRPFKDIRLTFEIFNLLGINNVLSYQWIQDTRGLYLAVPNHLTQRRFNVKLILKW